MNQQAKNTFLCLFERYSDKNTFSSIIIVSHKLQEVAVLLMPGTSRTKAW